MPIITNQTITATPAMNPGIEFPDLPEWYLLVNIILVRNISDPLDGYIIQIQYAVNRGKKYKKAAPSNKKN